MAARRIELWRIQTILEDGEKIPWLSSLNSPSKLGADSHASEARWRHCSDWQVRAQPPEADVVVGPAQPNTYFLTRLGGGETPHVFNRPFRAAECAESQSVARLLPVAVCRRRCPVPMRPGEPSFGLASGANSATNVYPKRLLGERFTIVV